MSQAGLINISGGGGSGSPIETLTGDSGGAVPPTANNINTLGSGSITTIGNPGTSTITTELTGLTNHSVLLGAGTTTITKLGPIATTGNVLMSQGSTTDPAFSTATYPATTTSQEILYSTATNVVGQLTTANSALPATNASGTLAMRLFSVVTQVFTGSGTYTPTTGMLYCIVECVGGGGAGGSAASGVSQSAAGGGGGAGGYARKTLSAATIGASQTVTIGAAGSAGSTGNNPGGNGGTTSLGSLLTATGGTGGAGSAAGLGSGALGGAGGVGSSGDFNTTGQPGVSGGSIFAAGVTALFFAGAGGNSFFGGGALGNTSVTGGQITGIAANSYGGGGSGGGSNGGADTAGGAGFAGVVVITEYVIA